ncbi:hypothetical protein OE88DRAFT_627154 [Heliocybe sulcata]|uniref:Uncharacterized protein n=1 Tax=Heliocybe sulcata TaxID=5364 RepID=A0A5C3NG90_9AGAM|nr:hypothetical protein OE88DRAFT_627154 [Heliocybe sulcata]
MYSSMDRSSYTALPGSHDEEGKPLFVSTDETDALELPLPRESRGAAKAIYILCTLVVVLAAANLFGTLYATRFNPGIQKATEELPHPDIFAGLPKVRVNYTSSPLNVSMVCTALLSLPITE